MSKKRCSNCGKRVGEFEPSCPRCGHSIPLVFAPPEDDYDSASADGGEEIDDLELLERAEAYVRGLPLTGLAGLAGRYEYQRASRRGPEDDAPARDSEACAESTDDGAPSEASGESGGGMRLERPRDEVTLGADGAKSALAGESHDVREPATGEATAGAGRARSASTGGECPECGRQAQKGWVTCPWCGAQLPLLQG